MAIAGRDVGLAGKCRLPRVLRAGRGMMAAPGARKPTSRNKRAPRSMAQAAGCSVGGRQAEEAVQTPAQPTAPPAAHRLLPRGSRSRRAPQATPPLRCPQSAPSRRSRPSLTSAVPHTSLPYPCLHCPARKNQSHRTSPIFALTAKPYPGHPKFLAALPALGKALMLIIATLTI